MRPITHYITTHPFDLHNYSRPTSPTVSLMMGIRDHYQVQTKVNIHKFYSNDNFDVTLDPRRNIFGGYQNRVNYKPPIDQLLLPTGSITNYRCNLLTHRCSNCNCLIIVHIIHRLVTNQGHNVLSHRCSNCCSSITFSSDALFMLW